RTAQWRQCSSRSSAAIGRETNAWAREQAWRQFPWKAQSRGGRVQPTRQAVIQAAAQYNPPHAREKISSDGRCIELGEAEKTEEDLSGIFQHLPGIRPTSPDYSQRPSREAVRPYGTRHF